MSPAVTLTTQVTCLLLLALVLAWFMRRGSARTLHLLWTATFALVLAGPALGLFGPSWEVPILPAGGGESAAAVIEATTSAPSDLSREAPGSAATRQSAEMREALVQAELVGLAARAGGEGSASAHAAAGPSAWRIGWIVWLVGCALSLASLAVAALRLRRLARMARPVRDPEWVREAAALRDRLSLRSEVRLLSSATVGTPMTGGLRRPVILLPASAAEWGPERRSVVLTHELIHVRRRDVLRQLIRRAVLALYWFHPLAWIASRHATLASEKACDEEVLALGARPSDYAQHLLFLATRLSRGPRALALPIVHPSQLEQRITSILARRRPHRSLARAALTLGLLVVVGVSVVARPVPIEEAPSRSPEAEVANTDMRSSRVPTSGTRPAVTAGLAAISECRSADSDSIRSMVSSHRVWVTGREDDDRTLETAVWGIYLCMRTHGSVVLNDDDTEVLAMGAGSRLLIESAFDKTHRLVITRGPAGIEREWSVDGVRRTFDEEARRWQNQVLAVLHGYLEVDRIRAEHAGLREINSLRRRISAQWSHHRALRDRISAHRRHVGSLHDRLSSYRDRLSPLEDVMRGASRAEAREALGVEIDELRARIRQIEDEIAAYDLQGRISRLERQIEDYDVDAKVAVAKAEMERITGRLDADGRAGRERAEEIRRSLADEMTELHVLNW